MTPEEKAYRNRFIKIDSSKFKIELVRWYAGDPYCAPGYHVFIRVDNGDILYSFLIEADEYNEKWVINDKEI